MGGGPTIQTPKQTGFQRIFETFVTAAIFTIREN
jgi:hypothetical protein